MTDKTSSPASGSAFPNALFGLRNLTETVNKVLNEGVTSLDTEISTLLEEFKAIDKAGKLTLDENELKARSRIVQELKNFYGDWKARYGDQAKNYLYETSTKKALEETDTGGSNGSDEVRAKVVGVENTVGAKTPPASQLSKSEKFGHNKEKAHLDGEKANAEQDKSPGPFHDEESVFGHGKKLAVAIPGQGKASVKVDGGHLAETARSIPSTVLVHGKNGDRITIHHVGKNIHMVSSPGYPPYHIYDKSKKQVIDQHLGHGMKVIKEAADSDSAESKKKVIKAELTSGLKESEGGENGDQVVRAKVVSDENKDGLTPPPSSQTSKSEKFGQGETLRNKSEIAEDHASQENAKNLKAQAALNAQGDPLKESETKSGEWQYRGYSWDSIKKHTLHKAQSTNSKGKSKDHIADTKERVMDLARQHAISESPIPEVDKHSTDANPPETQGHHMSEGSLSDVHIEGQSMRPGEHRKFDERTWLSKNKITKKIGIHASEEQARAAAKGLKEDNANLPRMTNESSNAIRLQLGEASFAGNFRGHHFYISRNPNGGIHLHEGNEGISVALSAIKEANNDKPDAGGADVKAGEYKYLGKHGEAHWYITKDPGGTLAYTRNYDQKRADRDASVHANPTSLKEALYGGKGATEGDKLQSREVMLGQMKTGLRKAGWNVQHGNKKSKYCPVCDGHGKKYIGANHGNEGQHSVPCKTCHGTGKLNETLPPNASASTYVDDFVHSDNSKFEGKDKKERIKMALGAYYGHHKEAFGDDREYVTIHSPGHPDHGKKARVFHKFPDGRINAQVKHPIASKTHNYTLKPGEWKEHVKEETLGEKNISNPKDYRAYLKKMLSHKDEETLESHPKLKVKNGRSVFVKEVVGDKAESDPAGASLSSTGSGQGIGECDKITDEFMKTAKKAAIVREARGAALILAQESYSPETTEPGETQHLGKHGHLYFHLGHHETGGKRVFYHPKPAQSKIDAIDFARHGSTISGRNGVKYNPDIHTLGKGAGPAFRTFPAGGAEVKKKLTERLSWKGTSSHDADVMKGKDKDEDDQGDKNGDEDDKSPDESPVSEAISPKEIAMRKVLRYFHKVSKPRPGEENMKDRFGKPVYKQGLKETSSYRGPPHSYSGHSWNSNPTRMQLQKTYDSHPGPTQRAKINHVEKTHNVRNVGVSSNGDIVTYELNEAKGIIGNRHMRFRTGPHSHALHDAGIPHVGSRVDPSSKAPRYIHQSPGTDAHDQAVKVLKDAGFKRHKDSPAGDRHHEGSKAAWMIHKNGDAAYVGTRFDKKGKTKGTRVDHIAYSQKNIYEAVDPKKKVEDKEKPDPVRRKPFGEFKKGLKEPKPDKGQQYELDDKDHADMTPDKDRPMNDDEAEAKAKSPFGKGEDDRQDGDKGPDNNTTQDDDEKPKKGVGTDENPPVKLTGAKDKIVMNPVMVVRDLSHTAVTPPQSSAGG